jgi:hypothetical protein
MSTLKNIFFYDWHVVSVLQTASVQVLKQQLHRVSEA